jgi:hypothetical protein
MKIKYSLNSFTRVFSAVAFALFFYGCEFGGGGSGSSSLPPSVPGSGNQFTVSSLAGTWGYSDYQFTGNGDDGISGNSDDEWCKQKITVTGNNMTFEYTGGIGASASQVVPLLTYRISWTITVGEKVQSPAGAYKIDMTQTSCTMTSMNQYVDSDYNAINAYGYSDWAHGTLKDISGRTSPDGETEKLNGSTVYNIISIINTIISNA